MSKVTALGPSGFTLMSLAHRSNMPLKSEWNRVVLPIKQRATGYVMCRFCLQMVSLTLLFAYKSNSLPSVFVSSRYDLLPEEIDDDGFIHRQFLFFYVSRLYYGRHNHHVINVVDRYPANTGDR